MTRSLILLGLALTLFGCSSQQTAATQAPPAAKGAVNADAASRPQPIIALTTQKLVYECPSCGEDFDGPGKCTMDQAVLVPMQVAYICPADNKPVDHAGKCPRCAANVRVDKTSLAAIPGK